MLNTVTETIAAPAGEQLPRLAFSLSEVAQMLGLSYITVYRLTQRGKLKSTGGLRHKLITREEITRYLKG